ncbi:MAG: hypothetical protein CM1200mP21_03860 [Candidatus Poseidoniales archaeon]|nr:MAG: hypothetical protein CM1200mP21_03860 [Candidatus Poseidoniales archaeon]
MSEHIIDSSEPYHPEKLDKKEYVGAAAYFEMDLRTGVILEAEDFPEMRKPSYKIHVDFGPVMVSCGAQPKSPTTREHN